MDLFHIAVPTYDLDAAEKFYTEVFGAEKARRYDDRVTFKFFDHQLVCHLSPKDVDSAHGVDPFERVYPRHFGMTFDDEAKFDATHARCVDSGWQHVQKVELRFPDWPERHKTFFVADPSHNILEFKYYFEQKYAF